MTVNPWNDADTATARDLLSRKAKNQEFIDAIGRSKKAAVSRMQYLDEPNYRQKKAERLQRARYATQTAQSAIRFRRVPDSVLADALRRNSADKSITAMLCGDPAPGQSALDRRRSAEVSA